MSIRHNIAIFISTLLFFAILGFSVKSTAQDTEHAFDQSLIKEYKIKQIEIFEVMKDGVDKRDKGAPYTYKFNSDGLLEEYTCPLCVHYIKNERFDYVSHYKYDEQQRITEKIDVADTIMYEIYTYSYPTNSQRIEKRYSVDASGKSRTPPALISTRTSDLDAKMRETHAVAVYESLQNRSPDEYNFIYNEMGDIIKRTQNSHAQTYLNFSFEYNSQGLKTKQYWLKPNGTKLLLVEYSYNLLGMLTTTIEKGSIHQYKYYFR